MTPADGPVAAARSTGRGTQGRRLGQQLAAQHRLDPLRLGLHIPVPDPLERSTDP